MDGQWTWKDREDRENVLIARNAIAMYIQFFCIQLFSGSGTIGLPSAERGGGTLRAGLSSVSQLIRIRE